VAEEDIVVRLYAVDENFRATLDRAGLSTNQFNRYLRRNFLALDKQGTAMNTLTGQTQSYGQTMHKAVVMGRRFQFGWLSIMFAGMALDRVFGSIIKKQFELWGVSQMTTSMWTVLMIPAMEKLTPLLFDMQTAIMDLPVPLQEAAGWGIIFAGTLGKILTVGGQVMLLLGGLKILAPVTFAAMAAGAKIVLPIIGLVAAGIAGLIAWVYIAKIAFEDGFSGIWDILTSTKRFILALAGPLAIFMAATIATVGEVINNWDKVVDILKTVWDWIRKVSMAYIKYATPLGWMEGARGLIGFQAGGLITRTGPAFLHAGERVVPKGRASQGMVVAPTINIEATVSNDMDVRILAEKINRYLADNLERQIIGRGSI